MRTGGGAIFLLAGLLCSAFSNEGTWVIDRQSRMTIHGSTNINTFSCQIGSYTGHDTLRYYQNIAGCEMQFSSSTMTIPIRHFDCGSRQISSDFWKTLKSETHPRLRIDFVSLQNIPVRSDGLVSGVVDISLAGVTTRYTILFDMRVKNNLVLLTGIHVANFSDFNLVPPEKLRGLIRVQQLLRVEFDLVLKPV